MSFVCPIHGPYTPLNTGTSLALCPQCQAKPEKPPVVTVKQEGIPYEWLEQERVRAAELEAKLTALDAAVRKIEAMAWNGRFGPDLLPALMGIREIARSALAEETDS